MSMVMIPLPPVWLKSHVAKNVKGERTMLGLPGYPNIA